MEKNIIKNEQVIEQALNKFKEVDKQSDQTIESIEISNRFIKVNKTLINMNDEYIIDDLTCLEKFIDLEELLINDQPIKSLNGLEKLTKLSSLCVNNNMLVDISALSNLTNMTQIKMNSNVIKDISALANLNKLCFLDISYNNIEEIDALKDKKNMLFLYVNNNKISDFSPVLEMVQLIEINISKNMTDAICSNDYIGSETIDILMNSLNSLRWRLFDREMRNDCADYFRDKITRFNPLYSLDIIPIAYYVDKKRKEDEEYVLCVVPKDRVVIINKKRGIAVDGADVCYPSYKMFLNCEDALDYMMEENYCI